MLSGFMDDINYRHHGILPDQDYYDEMRDAYNDSIEKVEVDDEE